MSSTESTAPADRDVPDRGPAPLAPEFVSDAVNVAREPIGEPGGAGLAAAIALTAILGATVLADPVRPSPPPSVAASAAAFEPTRFLLNALLLPALDIDAVPLRWVNPRSRSDCGPATEVLVNHRPLVAGALVPDTPFELAWRADGCRPFGVGGPRYDGQVRLTVYREDWGLSAMVEPSSLRVSFAGHETTLTQRRGDVLRFIEEDIAVPAELTAAGD
jgi:hypothetical protein